MTGSGYPAVVMLVFVLCLGVVLSVYGEEIPKEGGLTIVEDDLVDPGKDTGTNADKFYIAVFGKMVLGKDLSPPRGYSFRKVGDSWAIPFQTPDFMKVLVIGAVQLRWYPPKEDRIIVLFPMRAVGNLQTPPEGTGPPPTWKAAFHDALIVITDITGFRDDNLVPAPRMPIKIEPDGIACDGLRGVDDGAMLLVRIVADKSLDSSCKFGYIPQKDAWAQLPEDKQEGEYIPFKAGDRAALKKIGIAIEENEAYEAYNKLVVKFAAIYKPPVEFDLKNSDKNKAKSRDLTLAARLSAFGDNYLPQKTIMLVRTPLVLVHGINSSYQSCYVDSDWVTAFKGFGFICEGADHKEFDGNGDVHDSWKCIKSAIDTVTTSFEKGRSHSGKKIAIQKCDIVAHSYGGILSRWYVERTEEFEKRRDVRKLITMGTPHRGTPIANLLCDIYKRPLFYNAESREATPGYNKLGKLLDGLNKGEVRFAPKIRWHENGFPPDDSYEGQKYIVPSLQVLSVESEVLAQLNAKPFRDYVAYAAIVGTKQEIYWFNGLEGLEPGQERATIDRTYLPWYSGLDGQDGQGDAMVPVWSQRLPRASYPFPVNHTGYSGSKKVRAQVLKNLTDPYLPLGIKHRQPFLDDILPDKTARENLYIGSRLTKGKRSLWAAIEDNAIVRVRFERAYADTDLELKSDGPPVLGPKGGLVKVQIS